MKRAVVLMAATALLWAGCRSAPPPPEPPVAVRRARMDADQARRLTDARNWTAAARAWETVASRFSLLNQPGNQAVALHNLALCRFRLDHPDTALQPLDWAARLNEGRAPVEWWRNQILRLQILAAAGNEEARGATFTALSARPDLPATGRDAALFLNERARWEIDRSALAAAGGDLAQAETLFAAAADPAGLAAVAANHALLAEKSKDLVTAERLWRDALDRSTALADPDGIADACFGLGRTLRSAGTHPEESRELLERARFNYEMLGHPDLATTVSALLSVSPEGKP